MLRVATLVCVSATLGCNLSGGTRLNVTRGDDPLVAGALTDVNVFEVPGAGSYITANRIDADGVLLYSMSDDDSCVVGDVLSLSPLAGGDTGGLLLGYEGWTWNEAIERWTYHLSVYDLDCQRTAGPFEDVLDFLALTNTGQGGLSGLVMVTLEGDVLSAEPRSGTVDLWASDVGALYVTPDRVWTVEDGELRARNSEGRVVRTFGEGVTEVAVHRQSGRVVYAGADGLHLIENLEALPTSLGEDACGPSFANGEVVAFFSPCEEKRLVFRDLFRGAQLQTGPDAQRYRYAGRELFWITGGEDGVGALHTMDFGDDDPIFIADDVHLNSISYRRQERLHALHDYADGVGTYSVWEELDGPRTLVREDVWRFRLVETLTTDRVLVLHSRENNLGTLELLESGEATMTATGVHRNDFTTSWVEYDLALVITDKKDGAGRLEIWDTMSRRVWVVDNRVSSFREVLEPTHGVIYTVREGARAGVYFAEIDVGAGLILNIPL